MPVTLADRLPPSQVGIGLRAATREQAIQDLARLAAGSAAVEDPDRLAEALLAREARMTTGVGEGVALPHAWTSAVTATVIAVATFAPPVEWDALDGRPVDLAVLLAGPEGDARARVRTLAHVSRVLVAGGVRQRLGAAGTPEEVIAVLAEAERGL